MGYYFYSLRKRNKKKEKEGEEETKQIFYKNKKKIYIKIVLSVPRGWNVTPPGSFFLSLALGELWELRKKTYNRLTSLANNALKAQSSLSLSLSLCVCLSLFKKSMASKRTKNTHTHTHTHTQIIIFQLH